MKPAGFAIGVCAALALAAIAFDTEAGGRRGGSSARSSSGHAHGHHFRSRVFIGGSFYAWPRSYYPGLGYYYPGYYYYPPVAPLTEPYWYYCPESAAYYPYVENCEGGWEPVVPGAGGPQG